MVREHIREDERRLTIIFDTTYPETDGQEGDSEFAERFERAVIMAASLAKHFVAEGADVELLTPDARHDVPSGSGLENLYEILRSLAVIEPDPRDDDEEGGRETGPLPAKPPGTQLFEKQAARRRGRKAWRLLDQVPLLGDERRFKVVITSVPKGSIPANVWRSAHVVFMEDL
jgi:uncharacterized protein (DUF58 family)